MKRHLLLLSLSALLALSLTACGQSAAPAAGSSSAVASAGQSAASSAAGSGLDSEGETLSNLPVYPNNQVGTLPAETEKNTALETLIADTWDIPAEDQADTRYYYNYTDLNDDGRDELFAVAVGTYTSGTGGDSALIASRDDSGALTLLQTFTLMREPVIVSSAVTNGWHDLITSQTGGGAKSCYRVLKADAQGKYPNVGDGEALGDGQDPATLGDVSGTAILYNDLAADLASGTALHLGK